MNQSDLTEINWQEVEDCYGKATDIPEICARVLSSKKEVSQLAMSELSNKICHQGSVSEAAVKLMDFLFVLLQNDKYEGKKEVTNLIYSIIIAEGGGKPMHIERCRSKVWENLDLISNSAEKSDIIGRKYVQIVQFFDDLNAG